MKNEMTATIQARTSKELKENAISILDSLGLNLSTYINMAISQLVIQKGIPFRVKLNPFPYTPEELLGEVKATMAMEGMDLPDEEVKILESYIRGEVTGDEIRKKIMEEEGLT